MYPRNLQVNGRSHARKALVVMSLLIVGLAGCASQLRPTSNPAEAVPYVGMFTGEFVDGKPLYRFPAIEIVGTRGSIGAGT
jgi:hypothetical protein